MGDSLSVAAGVAGLLSLGLQTTEYLYKFYTAYRDRQENLARVADRLSDLLRSIQTVDEIVRTRKWQSDEKSIVQNIEKSITRCGDVIEELQDEARKFQKEPTDHFSKTIIAVGRRAAYPFRRSTLEKLDEDVDDFRDNLSMALQALQLKEHQNTQNDIEEMKNIIKNAQAQHLAASLRLWLKAPDATIDYNAACAKRHAKTGQWLVQSPIYTTWLQQDNSFLWLYGFAGCGKSVLCSTAIQHAFRHQRSQAKSAVAFFFFTFNDESKQDASAALRSLLVQISGQITGLEADLTRLKNSYNHGTPPVPTLMEHLRQAVSRCHHVYILLDALDESPAETARADVLDAIQTMRKWSLPGLRLLVTSRDVPDIRHSLQSATHVPDAKHVAMKNDNVQQDIRDYVSYQVDHDPQLMRWGDHRERIKEYLAQHAGGVFRWVECQLHPLRQCARSVKHLENCLRALPQSLDETYERMLGSIGGESRDEAQRMLALLCYSHRPLTVAEVIEALAVDLDDLGCYDSNRKLESADDLLRICPGLIEIGLTDGKDNFIEYEEDEDDAVNVDHEKTANTQIVLIAHFSVQEYLVSDRIKRSCVADFALSGPTQHAQISKTCLLYLENKEFQSQALTPDLVRQYPLAKFAARYWHHHYHQADNESTEQLAVRAVTLLTTAKTFDRWTGLYDADRPWFMGASYATSVRDHPSPIYYTALLGLNNVLVNILLNSYSDVNAQGGEYGNALQAASCKGYEKIVQILLDRGADVNAQGGHYGNALQAASYGGHEKMVQILLDLGVDVNAQGGTFGNALQAASYRGHEKVVEILLDRGADVNAQGGLFGNALQAASYRGHEKVVEILLDRGADVNAQGGLFGNALQAASSNGYEKVVQILLDRDADVNAQGGEYGNALQAASYGGHEKVVQILLDRDTDVNAQGGEYGNAMQAVSYGGHEKMVQILLDRGVDVNAQGGTFGNALQAASYRGHEKVVEILLDRGADVNAQGGEYVNALQAASYGGHEKVVQILLDRGADVNAQGGQYGNALQAASYGGHEKVVQILVNAGARTSPKE